MVFSRSGAWVAAFAASLVLGAQASAQLIVATPSSPNGWFESLDGVAGASAGITNTYARSGNGSAQIKLADALNSEADWVRTATGNYFLATLSTLSYEWYRSSASTANGIIAPNFALEMNDGKFLVYEPYYNNNLLVQPTNSWQPTNALNGTFWFTGNGTGNCALYGAFQSLNFFNTNCYGGTGSVKSFALYMGYAYAGTFDAAVDNVSVGRIGEAATTWNFETDTVVPEPASFVLLAAGLVGVAVVRRRARRFLDVS